MYYEKIEGWFNYEAFYQWVLTQIDAGVFVEIGVWKGKSITFMAERVRDLKKKIRIYAIDTFEGTADVPSLMQDPDVASGSLYEKYNENIAPVSEYIYTIRESSHTAHTIFLFQSIDVLFIDGDHSYDAVKKDIELWYPKVKPGGIISGHDFGDHAPGVKQAVKELIPGYKLFDDSSSVWFYKKIL
jgi:predicted O-methyltransferase YrrM